MCKKFFAIFILALGAAAAMPVDTYAQVAACGDRAVIVARLGDAFGEVRRGGGLAGPDAVFELFASEKTGSWTMLRTGTDGVTCMMVAGEVWEEESKPAEAQGKNAAWIQ